MFLKLVWVAREEKCQHEPVCRGRFTNIWSSLVVGETLACENIKIKKPYCQYMKVYAQLRYLFCTLVHN